MQIFTSYIEVDGALKGVLLKRYPRFASYIVNEGLEMLPDEANNPIAWRGCSQVGLWGLLLAGMQLKRHGPKVSVVLCLGKSWAQPESIISTVC